MSPALGDSQTVVLVEDEALVADSLATSLEEEGYCVKILTSGRDVIVTIAEASPAAVIMDIGLPGADGVTVAQLIRRMWPTLPIIFSTGHDDHRGLETLLGDGRTFLLKKPFAVSALTILLAQMKSSSAHMVRF